MIYERQLLWQRLHPVQPTTGETITPPVATKSVGDLRDGHPDRAASYVDERTGESRIAGVSQGRGNVSYKVSTIGHRQARSRRSVCAGGKPSS